MTWALWLAAPVGATVCAAVASWWHGRETVRRRRRPGTVEAMQAHHDYLDSLQATPRGTHRVGS